jgi:hypothetical protein
MNPRISLVLIILVSGAALLAAAPPVPPPPTNTDLPELTTRQKDQLFQLADAEANIQAINKALVGTGYKVGIAYDRIDSNLKGNELMDRKGGGPVRWDEFYGRTARDYGSNGWGDRRPRQFDYIYQANNEQIDRARGKIASLERNQAALLARRRTHEESQSRLWAMLAFQQIRDREIDDQPICRFALKPAGPAANVLRPIILFLRTADRVAADGLDSIKTDQPTTFGATGQQMQAAYEDLKKSLADALDSGGLDPARMQKGRDIKAACKELSEQCAVIADNYANALDRDDAREDKSKLEFRARLQVSLYTFALTVGRLHDDVTKTAKEWNVTGERGTPTPDVVAAVVIKAERPKEAPAGHSKDDAAADALQRGTIWSRGELNGKSLYRKLTVLDRDGDSVRIRYVRIFGTRPVEQIVTVRVRDGKFAWHTPGLNATDTGGDNIATIRSDELDIEWQNSNSHGANKGSFILHLEPSVPPSK